MNITDFITARLDDDEKIALAAIECNRSDYREPGVWTFDDGKERAEQESQRRFGGRIKVAIHSTVRGMRNYIDHSGNPHLYNPEMEHIARHDPARVLREVQAKRAILALHTATDGGSACEGCGTVGVCDDWVTDDVNDCPMLHALANVYADHPDFVAEWKL